MAILPGFTVRTAVQRLHERWHVGVRRPDIGRAPVGPVGAGKGRRGERRRRQTAGGRRAAGSGPAPVILVCAEQPFQEPACLDGEAKRQVQIAGLAGSQFHVRYGRTGEALLTGSDLIMPGRQTGDREASIRACGNGLVEMVLNAADEHFGAGSRRSRCSLHGAMKSSRGQLPVRGGEGQQRQEWQRNQGGHY